MSFYPEILTASQVQVLRRLGPYATERGFSLAGGTALAIQLGHRRSVDFDWFTRERFPDPLRFAREMRDAGLSLDTDHVERGTLHGLLDGVPVTFLEYRYSLLAPEIQWPEHCSLLSLDDVACMKLSAIGQRGARKDFIDLYALITRHRPLAELLSLYAKKFEVEDPIHVLYALTYFDDAERERMPEMLWEIDWETVKQTLRQQVQTLDTS